MSPDSKKDAVENIFFYDDPSEYKEIKGMLFFDTSHVFKDQSRVNGTTLFFGNLNGSDYYTDCHGEPETYPCSLEKLKEFEIISLYPFNLFPHKLDEKTEVRKTIFGGLKIKRVADTLLGIGSGVTFSRDEYKKIKEHF